MLKNRLAPAALVAAAAALVVLLCSAAAPAADLESKLDAKEAKLSKVRERQGVLTTTISRYRERIERLTVEVAALRAQEAEAQARLEAKQAELDGAVAELDVAKKHLAVVKARLKRSLVSLARAAGGDLRDRHAGHPQRAGRSGWLRRAGQPHRVPESDQRPRRSDRHAGARPARSGQAHGRPPALDEAADRSRPRRDRRRRAGPGQRPLRRPATANAARLDAAPARGRAGEDQRGREPRRGRRRRDPGGARRHAQCLRFRTVAGRADPLRLGAARSGRSTAPSCRASACAGGGCTRASTSPCLPERRFGQRRRARSSWSNRKPRAAVTATSPASTTAVACRPATPTSPPSRSPRADVSQGDVIGYVGCTGHCYGDHLHFEVRISGAPTDPLGYL